MPRLFFGLAPDTSTRAALTQWACDVAIETNGRPTPAANLHLTLAFLGDRPPAMLPRLEHAAARVRGAAFVLTLDRMGAWRKSGIAWAGASAVPPGLVELQAGLAAELSAIGVVLEERPFAAHVTLARRASAGHARPMTPPLHWPVGDFALFVSEPSRGGVAYRTLASWLLDA